MSQTVTLLGATGLVGSHLLTILLNDPQYSQVNVLTRRTTGVTHTKLNEVILDFSTLKAMDPYFEGNETVFCAIGTTNKKVEGDKHMYQKVDYDIQIHAAKAAAAAGVYGFALVSSIGANPENNNNFYLKLKGVIEESISKILIPKLIIVRPSVLIGKRDESRFGEAIAQLAMPAISWLLPKNMNKYKSIKAEYVAEAMVKASQILPRGIHFLEYDEMMKYVESSTLKVQR